MQVAYVLECRDGLGSQRYLCVPSQASTQDVWDRCYVDLMATGDEIEIIDYVGLYYNSWNADIKQVTREQ